MPVKNSNSNVVSSEISIVERIEFFFNVINQMCIGFITIYMTWKSINERLTTMYLHAWLVTIGFSLLMAEAMMSHYKANILTFTYKRTTKTTIHWILQSLGGALSVAGCIVIFVEKKVHFDSLHGKLGFSAFILCLVSMLSGLFALYAPGLKSILSPLLNKTFHNLLAIATFVLALVAQYFGYIYLQWSVEWDFVHMLMGITIVSLVLSCIGPLLSLYHKIAQLFDK